MSKLRMYLPDHMTRDQETVLERISRQFESRGWPKEQIIEFWQTPMKSLNEFCPLEALCADKQDLAQLAADKMLKRFDEMAYEIEAAAHEEQRRIKSAWEQDDSLVDVALDEEIN